MDNKVRQCRDSGQKAPYLNDMDFCVAFVTWYSSDLINNSTESDVFVQYMEYVFVVAVDEFFALFAHFQFS